MVEDNLSGNVLIEDSVNTWNIEKRMAEMKVHGLSIAVIHDYKVAWTKGYGFADTAAKTPVTDQTLFQAASISKSLNGVGILKLAQDKSSTSWPISTTILPPGNFLTILPATGKNIHA